MKAGIVAAVFVCLFAIILYLYLTSNRHIIINSNWNLIVNSFPFYTQSSHESNSSAYTFKWRT